ncbi:glycosyltransferase family 2 protein [Desulfosediminicola flagellatus]|uniref:glycosyltransferase family 2 protein n=1 Tax=Desulfosediminicola flagellatus TaxID=2569541 RepID=UPI0010ACD31F|nr:glycosyltransferase [Desulfosediminicola flagellatus]
MSNYFKFLPSPERDWDSRTDAPLVSVCVITYNQQDYIRQCLDGILMQQTDFLFEICLGEDESTDETRVICQEYADKYPGQINLILRSQSDPARAEYTSPALFNWNETLKACKGKYIAICEGDDYWTDPKKLQKQVDFLEENDAYSLVFHSVDVQFEGDTVEENCFLHLRNGDYSVRDILLRWSVPTCSTLFRSAVLGQMPYSKEFVMGDIVLFLICAERGKLFCMNYNMATYRRHVRGMASSLPINLLIQHSREMRRYFPQVSCAIFDELESGILIARLSNLFHKSVFEFIKYFCFLLRRYKWVFFKVFAFWFFKSVWRKIERMVR